MEKEAISAHHSKEYTIRWTLLVHSNGSKGVERQWHPWAHSLYGYSVGLYGLYSVVKLCYLRHRQVEAQLIAHVALQWFLKLIVA